MFGEPGPKESQPMWSCGIFLRKALRVVVREELIQLVKALLATGDYKTVQLLGYKLRRDG